MSFWEARFLWLDIVIAAAAVAAATGAIGIHATVRRTVFLPAALSQLAGFGVVVAFLFGHLLATTPEVAADASPQAVSEEPLPFAMADELSLTDEEHGEAHAPNEAHAAQCPCPPQLPRALAIFFACLGALWLGFLRDGKVSREWLLGAVFVGASAATLLLGGFIRQELHDVSDVLFGNAIMIERSQMVEAVAISALILALHLALAPPFLVHAFDPTAARAHGVPVRALDALLFLSMGIVVATGTRIVGALPIFAFSIFPAMGALTLVRRPRLLVGLAALLGGLAALVGYWASFVLSLPTGATMATAALLLFAVAGTLSYGRVRTRRKPSSPLRLPG